MKETLYRRNVVREVLRAGRREIHRLLVDHQGAAPGVDEIVALAQSTGVRIQSARRDELDRLSAGANHQGVAVEVGPYPYVALQDVIDQLRFQEGPALVLLLDLVQDPINVGRLLRTAEAVGVAGVVIQDRRAGEITPAVVTTSMGASELVRVAQVPNLVRAMNDLKAADLWLAGLDLSPDARPLGQAALDVSLGVVVGNEGFGLRRLVRETCDLRVFLPMRGRIQSLNAAVAGSILLYAAWQAQGFPGARPPNVDPAA